MLEAEFGIILSIFQGEVLSLCSSDQVDKTKGQLTVTRVGVCVRSVEGQLSSADITEIEDKRLLLGTGAIIMVLPEGATTSQPLSVSSLKCELYIR